MFNVSKYPSKPMLVKQSGSPLLADRHQTLNLTLLDPTGGANLGTQTTAVLTIVDNDNVPDLIVSNITAPVEIISGQQFEISWTVKNQGVTATTGTWNDYVYLQNQNGGQNYNIGTFEGSIPEWN